MKYSKRVLENGLKLLVIPMPTLASATITVWVKTGSRNEIERINGISHFLEHMAFKGTQKRLSAKIISEELDGMGAEHNAGTSKEWTNYYVKCRVSNLEKAFDILSDMTLNPLLKAEEIEREKGTIIEEIRMYEDTPMINIGEVFESLIYKNHPLGWDIAGTEKTVRGLKRDDFVSYRDRHFYTDNIIISVAGGVEEKQVINLTRKYFSEIPTVSGKEKELSFESLQTKPQIKLHNKKKEQAHIIFGYLADGKRYKNKFAQTLLATVLGGGMSSRMFLEVRERRGLAYAVRTSMDRYSDCGYLGTYAGLDVKKADEALKVILDEHLKLKDKSKKVTEKELTKAKEFLKGHLALALEDTRDVSSFFTDQEMFLPKVLTPNEVFKKIDQVKAEELYYEAERLFVPERLNLAIIGPYEDGKRFEKIID